MIPHDFRTPQRVTNAAGQVFDFEPRVLVKQHIVGKRARFAILSEKLIACRGAEGIESLDPKVQQWLMLHLDRQINAFLDYNVRRILADRDLLPEGAGSVTDLFIKPNGSGCTNVIQAFRNYDHRDPTLVEVTLLEHLNRIYAPDAYFTRIDTKRNEKSGNWEVCLEEDYKGLIPLSKTGSGLKTVLLVLANVILVPVLADNPLDSFIFAFEELENNLHPAVQRRLFQYLRHVAVDHGATFFVTTHSNVV